MSKILVVEDNPHERDGLRRLLETSGFAMEVAADGVEALRQIGRGEFDLLLVEHLDAADEWTGTALLPAKRPATQSGGDDGGRYSGNTAAGIT